MAAFMDTSPPKAIPRVFEKSGLTYTSCYCEENIYCMVRDYIDLLDRKSYTVVFLSNQEKCKLSAVLSEGCTPSKNPRVLGMPFYTQKYHPLEDPMTPIYDFDTALDPFGLPFETYFSKTLFGDESFWNEPDTGIDQEAILSFIDSHPRFFKLVPAEDYLRLFASTRKHMMKKPSIHKTASTNADLNIDNPKAEIQQWENEWSAKPPDYSPIRTEESENTLDKFLDFSSNIGDKYGRIVNERDFWKEFTGMVEGYPDHPSIE